MNGQGLVPAPTAGLKGCRILLTRDERGNAAAAVHVRRLGGEPVSLPLLEIVPAADTAALDRCLYDLERFGWIVFSSANAVRFTLRRLEQLGLAAARLKRRKLAAVGEGTAAALAAEGLSVDLLPAIYRWQELAEALVERVRPGEPVLLPRGDRAKPELLRALQDAGLQVTPVVVYENRPATGALDGLKALAGGPGVDAILLASDSAVEALASLLPRVGGLAALAGVPVASAGPKRQERPLVGCIGPNTARTARALQLPVDVIAPRARIEALIEAMAGALARRLLR
ncbi:MAG TPA: uroporphyrinogen-III synthase [Bacillota bacterium]